MHARALGIRDVMKIDGCGQFCKRPWMWSAQLAALFPISIGAWQPGSTVVEMQHNKRVYLVTRMFCHSIANNNHVIVYLSYMQD